MSTLPQEEEARKLGQALGWTEMLFHYINITTKPVVVEQGGISGHLRIQAAGVLC